MKCELCGKSDSLIRTKIEGAVLEVCKSCSELGEVVSTPKKLKRGFVKKEEKSNVDIILDYSKVVRNKREELSMTLKDVAQKIGEKESVIRRIEHGDLIPSEKIGKKLEKALKIELYGEIPAGYTKKHNKGKKDLTIGDIVKIKEN